MQLQVLKSQKTIGYPSPKQNPADDQQHKYVNYGIENALGAEGKKEIIFLNNSIFIALYILSGQMWLNMDFGITLNYH